MNLTMKKVNVEKKLTAIEESRKTFETYKKKVSLGVRLNLIKTHLVKVLITYKFL